MYLAHISEDRTREQSIREHLQGTAELAGKFAEAFGCRAWGYGCGMFHDIGKYSERFQQRLLGGSRTDHATAGAAELFHQKKGAAYHKMAAYCIAGHHTGLPDGGTPADGPGDATLMGRMKKPLEEYQAYREEIELPVFPQLPFKQLGQGGFSVSFFIRMLFSCLVDADFLDTEAFMTQQKAVREQGDSMEILLKRLEKHIEPWLLHTDTNTVNGRRTAILRACMERGREEQGLYQLTVPTGGGKTVSSLAFALQQAKRHHLDHIIYVIPYTSIIEQNAAVFQDILGKENVLEDHCNVVWEDGGELSPLQLAAENWDRPVIVTTNVQFFESLFSNRTSQCRKLHNIANSVLIFDEAQMLPVNYLLPCVRAVSELIYNYHCTAVLCTATQPSLSPYFPEQLHWKEICPEVERQYAFFRRTTVQKAGELTEEELTERLRQEAQALCILNSRRRVQRVYEAVKGEGVYHLSTLMYPGHRRRTLKQIRQRLKEGKTCLVIATSLVEAGVDLDFQTVYRELAGLDSVIQAAGRCNREGGRDPNTCATIIFTLSKDEELHLPTALKLPISVGGQVAEDFEDLMSLDAIRAYFDRLYHYQGEGLDQKQIIRQFEEASGSFLFPFHSVAEQFQLIESSTTPILIGEEPEAKEILERIRGGECSRSLIRKAGQYCINVYKNDFERMNGAGWLEILPAGFYTLRDLQKYQEETGLLIHVSRGDALFG